MKVIIETLENDTDRDKGNFMLDDLKMQLIIFTLNKQRQDKQQKEIKQTTKRNKNPPDAKLKIEKRTCIYPKININQHEKEGFW